MQPAFDQTVKACQTAIPLPGPNSTGEELFRMGMLYSTGQGGAPLDYVSAHMLFNLAALRGSEAAKERRRDFTQGHCVQPDAQAPGRSSTACAPVPETLAQAVPVSTVAHSAGQHHRERHGRGDAQQRVIDEAHRDIPPAARPRTSQ